MAKYALRYTWTPETKEGGYTKEEIGELGGADALLGISIIHNDDGCYSQAIFGIDGKENRPLTQEEIFKAWMMLGLSLHDNGKLNDWKKEFVKDHADMVRRKFHHDKILSGVKNVRNN